MGQIASQTDRTADALSPSNLQSRAGKGVVLPQHRRAEHAVPTVVDQQSEVSELVSRFHCPEGKFSHVFPSYGILEDHVFEDPDRSVYSRRLTQGGVRRKGLALKAADLQFGSKATKEDLVPKKF